MFTATATSKDGFTKSASVSYTVTAAPNTPPPAPAGPITAPTTGNAAVPPAPGVVWSSASTVTEPGLSDLKVRPHAFRGAARGRAIPARSGATVTYRDSLGASSTFRVYRKLPGVRRGRRRIKASSGQHVGAGRRCTRLVLVGSFKHRDAAGADRLHFTGRIAGHALSPGAYALKDTAKLAGQLSRTVSASFVILAPL